MYTSRSSTLPKTPNTLAEISHDYLASLKTDNGQNFLLVDSGSEDPQRILIFGNLSDLTYLGQAQEFHIDGTFWVTPQDHAMLFFEVKPKSTMANEAECQSRYQPVTPICNYAGHYIDGLCHCVRCLTGTKCEVLGQCQHGGTMTGYGNCICMQGYTGTCCERLHCSDNGIPIQGRCECEPGFEGKRCQWAHCENRGRADGNGGCICQNDNFYGKRCRLVRCANGGGVIGNHVGCDCSRTDFTGLHCEVPLCYRGKLDTLANSCVCSLLYRGDHCRGLSLFAAGGAVALVLIFLFVAFWVAFKLYKKSKTDTPHPMELRSSSIRGQGTLLDGSSDLGTDPENRTPFLPSYETVAASRGRPFVDHHALSFAMPLEPPPAYGEPNTTTMKRSRPHSLG